MNRRRNSLILSGFLAMIVSASSFAQSYDAMSSGSFGGNNFYFEAQSLGETNSNAYTTGHQTYTIKSGDTLGSISKKFFGTTTKWKEIAKANNISDPGKIKVGQMIEIPTTNLERGEGNLVRHRPVQAYTQPVTEYQPTVHYQPVTSLPPIVNTSYDTAPAQPNVAPKNLPLPPVTRSDDTVLYSGSSLPQIILPGERQTKKEVDTGNHVTFNGLTGLINTFAAYPLGENLFSTAFGMTWNKIVKREGERLATGEDGDFWEFPVLMTYAGENFEVAFKIPFESYDIYAPITYNFKDGSDSGMGDCQLRFKFTSESDEMASCLGLGAIFPTSDIGIGNTDTNNAWELFAGLSTKRKEGGNLHLNGGYQAGDGNTAHEGVFVNVGFDYRANDSFTFIGEVNFYNRVNAGKSTDLNLGLRYHVKPGMSLTLAAPISLSNDMFFGYDYRLQGLLQYHY